MKNLRRRIRVLQVIHSLHWGGAEKVIANLVDGIDANYFHVDICCIREIGDLGNELKNRGHNIIVLPFSHRSRYLTPLRLLAAVRRLRPDIVHTHGLVALGAAGPLASVGLLPHWIHTSHYGNYPYPSARAMWLERVFVRRASQLVAVAEAQRQAMLSQHGLADDQILTVHNGVAPNNSLANFAERRSIRAEFGIPENAKIVGTIAALSEQKGVTHFLLAARDVLETHHDVRYLIVGGGPLEAQLRAEATFLGLSESVVFTSWRNDVSRLITIIDVWVMSSLWEAMPLALLEAMAAARPIVATDVGDNSRFLDNGNCGLVIQPGSASAIADAVRQLLDQPDLADRLAARALKRFHDHYTTDKMVDAHEDMYTQALLPKSQKYR